ncbi:porin [Aliikangiella sp. G2MR2-5]|uniref:porin n=1 Tax=Aliikangiella sp. G2MR2-5 TaxID=2788943 RepID=UPI0018AAB57C|nr:porin [Aliikangiella sp. G2MR2-5]
MLNKIKMMRGFTQSLLMLALFLIAFTGSAEVRVNGFANIIAGTTLDDDDQLLQYDGDFSFESESLFGLQFSTDLGDGLSATAQLVARARDEWSTDFTWAYLSYELSDSSSLQFGRIRIPFYRYSEFLEVGYAYHWIAPPRSVYDLPLNNFEGISYTYNTTFGDFDSALQIATGSTDETLKFDVDGEVIERPSDVDNTTSFVWMLSDFNWTFRLGYTICPSCTLGLPTDAAASLVPDANTILLLEDDASFTNLGVRYSGERWFTEFEFTQFSADDSILPDETDSAYITFGVNTDNAVYFLTYEIEDATPKTALDLVGIPSPTLDAVASAFHEDTETISFGIRYDFHPSAAFKINVSRFEDNLTQESVNLLTTGVSLVF